MDNGLPTRTNMTIDTKKNSMDMKKPFKYCIIRVTFMK